MKIEFTRNESAEKEHRLKSNKIYIACVSAYKVFNKTEFVDRLKKMCDMGGKYKAIRPESLVKSRK